MGKKEKKRDLKRLKFKGRELKNKSKDLARRNYENDNQLYIDSTMRKLELENDNLEQNVILRRSFATKIFLMAFAWMVFSGSAFIYYMSRIPEVPAAVMITFMTTTLINVLGLLTIVAKYIFPNPGVAALTKAA